MQQGFFIFQHLLLNWHFNALNLLRYICLMTGKIICVGMHKTGTTTMEHALTMLGYRVKRDTARLTIPILRGDYDKAVRLLRDYDAVEDVPWFMIYKELDQRIPGCKFILTLRNEENWYKSICRHVADLNSAHSEWIFGRGKGLVKDHKENTLEVYRKHIASVHDYFKDRPDDLLVLRLEDGEGWEKLCPFLGKEIPETPFPHANKSDFRQDRTTLYWKFRLSRHKVKNNFKIWYISLLGLWK